jgi:hypothetical protein
MSPLRATALALLAAALTVRAADPPADSLSAPDLAARLDALQQNGSSYLRMRLEVENPSSKSLLQIHILQLRTPASTSMLCQTLWPKPHQGESVLLKQTGNQPPTGTRFTPPDAIESLDFEALGDPLFGSDLRLVDLIENCYAWESQTFVGDGMVGRVNCRILESKPGRGRRAFDTMVRSWIDTARLVPLRVEKFSKPGPPVRIIETTRVTREDDGRYIPAALTVRAPGLESVTRLEGSRINTRVSYQPDVFTPGALRQIQKSKVADP